MSRLKTIDQKCERAQDRNAYSICVNSIGGFGSPKYISPQKGAIMGDAVSCADFHGLIGELGHSN